MIRINSFTPVDNFTRRSWEFYDDQIVVKTKSLTFDYENEIKYEKIKYIRSKRMADLSWLWASFVIVVLLGLGMWVLNIVDLSVPSFSVIRKIAVVFALVMILPAFRTFEYYSFLDADKSFLVTVRVSSKSRPLLLDAIKLVKQKTKIIGESYFTDSFPSTQPLYQYEELDFPDFLNKAQVRFYKDRLVAVENSLAEKITTVIKYDEFSGKTKIVKIANERWDTVWSIWLFFMCITGLLVITFFEKQMEGNDLLLYLFYGGFGLLIPLFFLRYIKSETLIFYDKQDNVIFGMKVSLVGREKLKQIVGFVEGKVESQD